MALLTALMAVVDNSNPEVINNVAKSLVCYSPLPPPFPPLSFSPFPSLALSFFPLFASLPLFLPPSLPHCYICRRICWKTRGCSCSGLMLCCARKLRTAVSRERGERAGRERGESGERAGRERGERGERRRVRGGKCKHSVNFDSCSGKGDYLQGEQLVHEGYDMLRDHGRHPLSTGIFFSISSFYSTLYIL